MTLPRASEINRDTNGPLWVQAHITELRAEVDSILNGAAKAEFAALLADLKVVRAEVFRIQTEVNADRAKCSPSMPHSKFALRSVSPISNSKLKNPKVRKHYEQRQEEISSVC
jgi:hypothetical protein